MFVVFLIEIMFLYEFYFLVNEILLVKNVLILIYVDLVNGEMVVFIDSFYLVDFFYGFYIDLNLLLGDYIVGIVILFFIVVIFIGLVV